MKHTTETFVARAISIHGNKYDYSKVNYVNSSSKVKIICPIHGEFEQRPNDHLMNHGCQKCGKESYALKNSSNAEDFIKKAISVHGDKYDYSKVKYINYEEKVTIVCPIHGEFEQTPHNHLRGNGCNVCSRNQVLTTETFIEKARSVHGDKYDYSKVEYVNNRSHVIIICPEHGEFKQIPYSHLQKHECPKCCGCIALNIKATKEFVSKARSIHGGKYDYSKTNYARKDIKVIIVCPEHGEFEQTPGDHLKGSGCPGCSESHGEREISKWLDDHNIRYEREKKFKNLIGVNGGDLRFDFYLPDHNICIEFDGIQHRQHVPCIQTKQQFLDLQEHDKRKNEFCSKNGIKLVRIWKENKNFYKSEISQRLQLLQR